MAVVALPTMKLLVGRTLPRAGRRLLAENVGLLVGKWVEFERQQQQTAKERKRKKIKKSKAARGKASQSKMVKRGRR
jgi:hypothetical protein